MVKIFGSLILQNEILIRIFCPYEINFHNSLSVPKTGIHKFAHNLVIYYPKLLINFIFKNESKKNKKTINFINPKLFWKKYS